MITDGKAVKLNIMVYLFIIYYEHTLLTQYMWMGTWPSCVYKAHQMISYAWITLLSLEIANI